MSPLKCKNNMLPASSIMSRWQTKKFTTQDYLICFEQIWAQICSKLDCGADCINEALSGLNNTVALTTKTTSKPQCCFYFNNDVYNFVTWSSDFRNKSHIQSRLWFFC